MTRYGMAIEVSKCIGCHTCSTACKANNNLPVELWWNRVDTDGGAYMDTAKGEYPATLSRMYYPINCQQCSAPACVDACPTGASYVRETDNLVLINADECIGCNSCQTACPYDVRTLYNDELEYYVEHAMGDWDAPVHTAGTMSKCTGCANRIDRGAVPACMEFCPVRCRHWGDLDDPESEISKFLEGKTATRLMEDSGTEPNVFYIL